MKPLDITDGFFQETTLSATESKRKNIVIICVFICRNFCNSQSIAIQPLDFNQILSKNFFFFLSFFLGNKIQSEFYHLHKQSNNINNNKIKIHVCAICVNLFNIGMAHPSHSCPTLGMIDKQIEGNNLIANVQKL